MRRVVRRVAFTVTAGQIRGQGRPRFAIAAGRPTAYKSGEDKAWERAIREAFLAQGGADMGGFADEVHVLVQTRRRLPGSAPKRVTEQPDTCKPDADNILKSVLDALNGVAWRDDRQVTKACVEKLPRTRREGELMEVTINYFAEMNER